MHFILHLTEFRKKKGGGRGGICYQIESMMH
jgi:hypothetical protein